MRVAYVDMIGGAAGDMLLGAWVDAGLDVAALERALRSVVATGWELTTERVERGGVAATYLDLVIPGEDHHAHDAHGHHQHGHDRGHRLADIVAIVAGSGLSARQIERACAVYRRIAAVEAAVAGIAVDELVFHRVGQVDAILDVAGTCIALDLLGIDELRCSPFPVGRGRAHHGRHPEPSRETAALVAGFPQRAVEIAAELVTVTGAAILATLASDPGRGAVPAAERTGYGAGRSEFPFPNVVKIVIGPAA